MEQENIFNAVFNGGNFTLPYLLKFTSNKTSPLCFVNNNENIEFNGDTYLASSFEYIPPDAKGIGASLKISGIDNDLIPFIELADETFRLDIKAVLVENGTVQSFKQYTHFQSSVSYTQDMEITFELSSDDRMDMAFPPYKFDTDTNKGNA